MIDIQSTTSNSTTPPPTTPSGQEFMQVLLEAIFSGSQAQANAEAADAKQACQDADILSSQYGYWDEKLDDDAAACASDPDNTSLQTQYNTDSSKMNSNVGQTNTMAQNQENAAETMSQTTQQWTTMMSSSLDFMSKVSGMIQNIIS